VHIVGVVLYNYQLMHRHEKHKISTLLYRSFSVSNTTQ